MKTLVIEREAVKNNIGVIKERAGVKSSGKPPPRRREPWRWAYRCASAPGRIFTLRWA